MNDIKFKIQDRILLSVNSYGKRILLVLLSVLLVPFLQILFLQQELTAQTNEVSAKVLIDDAIQNLHNNDTTSALTHSNLAMQQLPTSPNNVSSSIDSARVLLTDAIENLRKNDTTIALTYLKLVDQQLQTNTTSVVNDAVNMTSERANMPSVPVANNMHLRTTENTPIDFNLSAKVVNSSNISQFSIVKSPPNGEITSFDQDTGKVTYKPAVGFGGIDRFKFRVDDSRGYNHTIATVTVAVNSAPIAIAGQDQIVYSGETVTLNGESSRDPDGEGLQYTWIQIEGTPNVEFLSGSSDINARFIAPTVQDDTTYQFKLIIRDDQAQDTDIVKVIVRPPTV
jgi:Bacterial Ig domain/PKD domain